MEPSLLRHPCALTCLTNASVPRQAVQAFRRGLCAAPSSYDDLFAHSGSWFYHRNDRLCECLSQCPWSSDLNRGFGGDIGLFRDDIGSSCGHGAGHGDSPGKPTSRFSRSLLPARSFRLFLSGHRNCLRKIKTRQTHPGVAHSRYPEPALSYIAGPELLAPKFVLADRCQYQIQEVGR